MNQGSGLTRLILALVVGLILGVLLGMLLFWGPFKVQYTGARSYDLIPEEKAKYVTLVADSYALDRNRDRAASYLIGSSWTPEEIQQAISDAVLQYEAEGRPDVVQRLRDLELVLGLPPAAAPEQATPPAGATATPEPATPPAGAPSILDRIRNMCLVFILALLVLIVGYALYRWLRRRRGAAPAARPAPSAAKTGRIGPAPTTVPIAPAEEWKGVGQPPLGHFITTYKLGEDTYDESFSIETPAGEFLGECGMGISETIGKGDPDQVTAFEVWLFDKSDIRTVTKVLMSDHAYHDEALRGKLAAKGEAVLAQVGIPFMLETTGLQVQVNVTDLAYGEGPQPPKSFFRQLTVELVALARPVGGD